MRYLTVVALTLLGACDSAESKGERVCREAQEKLDACELVAEGLENCDPKASAPALCAGQCLIDAPCEELLDDSMETGYFQCIARCSGANESDFFCADGGGYVAQAGVCDGISQCLDGSDEVGCATGGDSPGASDETEDGRSSDEDTQPSGDSDSGGTEADAPDGVSSAGSAAPGETLQPSTPDPNRLTTVTELCDTVNDHEADTCGQYEGGDRASARGICVGQWQRHDSQGCGAAYESYLICRRDTTIQDCDEGLHPSCEQNLSAYLGCGSSFTALTSCSARGADDNTCAGQGSYAYLCLGSQAPFDDCVTSSVDSSAYCCF